MPGLARKNFVGQLSTTVRSRSVAAKSSLLCVARSMAALRLRQVFSASVMYALSVASCAKRHASSRTNSLSCAAASASSNRRARPMQHVEQERFEQERILVEALEVEALEPLKRQRVLDVVEERRVRPALHPPVQVLRQTSAAGCSRA